MTDKYGKIHTDGSRSGGQPLDDSIEAKALALVNEIAEARGKNFRYAGLGRLGDNVSEALCRVIEQHEAFKQEVSDAVQSWVDGGIDRPAYLWFRKKLDQFIIPKPKRDPLVEALEGVKFDHYPPNDAKTIRAALDALGFEIREKGQ